MKGSNSVILNPPVYVPFFFYLNNKDFICYYNYKILYNKLQLTHTQLRLNLLIFGPIRNVSW